MTGNRGFIGSALVSELELAWHEVFGFDVQNLVSEDVVAPNSVQRSVNRNKIDLVVHLAAEVGKLNCERNPERAIEVNVTGTLNVAKACAKYGIPLVYVSTSEIYGDWGGTLVLEDDPPQDLSGMYAITKLAGEQVAQTYAPEGLKIIRPMMPYGPGVPPGPGRRALDNLVWQALTDQPMVVHRGAARSWCWIDDVARGMRCVIEKGEPGAYNVGRDDDEVSMTALANMIVSYVGASYASIEVVDPPARQTAVKRISCAKLLDLGWEPVVSLGHGLPLMIEWIREWSSNGSQA